MAIVPSPRGSLAAIADSRAHVTGSKGPEQPVAPMTQVEPLEIERDGFQHVDLAGRSLLTWE